MGISSRFLLTGKCVLRQLHKPLGLVEYYTYPKRGCVRSVSSFSFSGTGVTNARRRVLNKTNIQPSTPSLDGEPNKRSQFHIPTVKTRVQIVLELVVALIIVTLPFSVQAGIFSEWLSEGDSEQVLAGANVMAGPADVELLSSTHNPSSLGRGGSELIVDENALVSTGPIGEDEMAALGSDDGEISVYTVREADSLSQIAEMFGVTGNTIKWANDLAKGTEIQPGDTLVILPIAGVSHVVKKGDTISTIAKKYEGDVDEILSYNQLDSNSDITVGDTLIIPGGAMHSAASTKSTKGATPTRVSGGGASGAGFIHPAPGAVKTQGIHGYNAVDLAGSSGSTIRAAADGEIIIAKGSGWNGGYGTYIVVRHSNGTQTLYAHLSSLSVGVGEYVDQGQTIGGMGNTGKSTGTHLHFEVRGARNPF